MQEVFWTKNLDTKNENASAKLWSFKSFGYYWNRKENKT
jgi:hypothetical protein